MSQALLAFQNILQNSNIFNRSRETVIFMPFGDKKVTQFSGFLPTSVSYLKRHKFVTLGDRNFRANEKKKSGSQHLPLEFLKFLKMQLLRLSENHKNHKNS